jgi:uncharacterized protein (DUF736 family)
MNLSGALFKNKYKEAGSNQPDYKGTFQDKATREKVLDIAAWEQTSRDGNTTYLSLKISEPFQTDKPKNEFIKQAAPQPAALGPDTGPEDDIPF